MDTYGHSWDTLGHQDYVNIYALTLRVKTETKVSRVWQGVSEY